LLVGWPEQQVNMLPNVSCMVAAVFSSCFSWSSHAGGNAEQKAKNARLNPSLAASAVLEGDVLRACTCTNIVYQSGALAFGMQRPTRSIVVYGADGQAWPQVSLLPCSGGYLHINCQLLDSQLHDVLPKVDQSAFHTDSVPSTGCLQVVAALQKGLVADGPVTLVLERQLTRQAAAVAADDDLRELLQGQLP
jgi:hypothetical protein